MENKYMMIYQNLVKQIESGVARPGSLLPSEKELTDQFDTSRETIRKALHLLSQNGFIQKVRGKGSIVLDVGKFEFPVSGLISFKEISQKMGQPVRTFVHEISLIKPTVDLAKRLPDTDFVWKVIRAREIGGEKIILDKDYLSKNFVPRLTKEICETSIYDYLENELDLNISFAKKEIIVETPSEEDELYLDLKGHHNVVVIKNYVYLDDATLFQYTESRHRPDKFRFVDFARRSHM